MPTKVKGTTGVDKIESNAIITNPAFSGNATVSGSLTVGGVNVFSGPYRNLIINGDMKISQRGTSFVNTSNGMQTLDRFAVTQVGAGVATVNQSSDSPTISESGVNNTKCLEVDVTTADTSVAASDLFAIIQQIEGNNILNAGFGQSGTRYITVSFWVKTNKTGTYCIGLTNAIWGTAGERDYTAEYTVTSADTWEKKIITIPVVTTGTWAYDNSNGLSVRFCLYSGSNYHLTKDTWVNGSHVYAPSTSNQVNLFDSTSNYFKITLVQLEVGEGASDFEFLPYDVELARCLRYFYRASFSGQMFGTPGYVPASGLVYRIGSELPVEMRATPDVNFSSPLYVWDGNIVTLTGFQTNLTNKQRFDGDYVVASGLTTGRYAKFYSGYIDFTAEI